MSRVYGWAHRSFPGLVDCHPIDVPGWLARSGFGIVSQEAAALWGLPVAVVIARRAGEPA
jgi:hypothetical protein